MTEEGIAGRYRFPGTPWDVRRVGYGGMQLAGPGVFGPPKDRGAAIAVLREAIDLGVDHIDTSDFYGPHVVNQLIREALHPYPDDLVIVTKVGSIRGEDGSWPPAYSRSQLRQQIEDNLHNLGLEQLHVVNLRARDDMGSFEAALSILAELQVEGLIGHIGLSAVSAEQVRLGRSIVPVVCVQNQYNVAYRKDDALIDELADAGIPYVPFFPLGGFNPLQVEALDSISVELGSPPLQVAQAWLLHRADNILLIPGTSSPAHLRENLAVGDIVLTSEALAGLDAIAGRGGGEAAHQ
ncbi:MULTISPECIES: oxidoreductase [unclassified Sphingomonas]|uniref:oxidoreductase n=1 Tax=unclassified Sphingomonas TaxID=196159 RepID=UPI00226AF943|nr:MULTISPECIES: oxidoreductase [unclassified Sphingomonas]